VRTLTVAFCIATVVLAEPLPSGPGLAARYPGDRGIAADANVVFAEDFERETVADVVKRWNEAKNPRGKALHLEGEPGKRCLRVTATHGENTGGHLYKRFAGQKVAFARFYVKFPKPGAFIHHFVGMGGYFPSTRWPQGHAGVKPKGDDRFTVGIEPHANWGRERAPGHWNFYTYWHEMKPSAGGKHWGNALAPSKPAVVPTGRWQCVEFMIRCNRPGARDGELALWLDGKLVAHFVQGVRRTKWTGMGFRLARAGTPFEGLSWRTTEKLDVNFFCLSHYVTPGHQARSGVKRPPRENRVWFDSVVVAKQYIGPLVPAKR